MKSLVLTAIGEPLQLINQPTPVPGPDQVLVKVAGCGVCHTDIGYWKDGVPTKQPLPLTLGHEISGVVEEAGAGCKQWVGKEVIVPAVIPCGTCTLCREGRGNICQAQVMPGNDMDGGFADYVVVPARGLCEVSDRGGYDLSDLSVIADAVTTPDQAVVRSGLRKGDLAIINGTGGVGTYCVQIAAALGARVIAIDVDPAKLEAVADHCAGATLNAASCHFKELKSQIRSLAKEWQCPAHGWKIFECSGSATGQLTAFGLMNTASTLMVIGFTLAKSELRLSNLMALDATVQGTWGCKPELYPEVLEMVVQGRIQLRPFIETFPLSKGPDILARAANHEYQKRPVLKP